MPRSGGFAPPSPPSQETFTLVPATVDNEARWCRGIAEGAEGCGAERHSDKLGLAGAAVVSGAPTGAYRKISRTGPEPPLNGGGKAANRANLRLAPVLTGPHGGRSCKEMGLYGSKAAEAPGKKREKAQQAETAAPILTQTVQLQSLIAALGAAS